ncbi:hypothetical protein V6N12_042127 [Hibiscus sabdariffa]|uniref:Uncharacterized protein n=1 Tax=Hibiscus sabdariffa TaxID=183260 RepID=A0ABR2EDV7_9ROSI
MADDSGAWRWERFQHLLPIHLLVHIAVVKGPSRFILEDTMGWKDNRDFQFTIHSAYSPRDVPPYGPYDIV